MHSIRHAFSILLQNQLSVGGMGIKIASISKKNCQNRGVSFYKIPGKTKVRVMKERKEETKKGKRKTKKEKERKKRRIDGCCGSKIAQIIPTTFRTNFFI